MASNGSERGLSPVIGTVLLVAIVVVLAAVGAGLFLDLTEEREPAPTVSMELANTAVPLEHELRIGSGDRLRGAKVELQGVANESTLSGRELTAGDAATVYPVAEEIDVVWYGDEGTSYVLQTLEPDPSVSVPDPEEGCPWVQQKKNNGVTAPSIDVVLNCDAVFSGNVDLESGGLVLGEIDSGSDADIDGDGVYGPVEADGSVDVDDTNVTGPVTAGDDVTTDGAHVWGDVQAGDVDLDATTVHGAVVSSGPVNLDDTTVTGEVYLSGSLSCTGTVTVDGQDCSSYSPEDYGDY
jgi:flagellin-like protein